MCGVEIQASWQHGLILSHSSWFLPTLVSMARASSESVMLAVYKCKHLQLGSAFLSARKRAINHQNSGTGKSVQLAPIIAI